MMKQPDRLKDLELRCREIRESWNKQPVILQYE
jgi:hypothetical protein